LDPLHQFTIVPLIPIHIGGYDLSFTNSSLFMLIAVGLSTALLVYGMRPRALVPGRWQSVVEVLYEFIATMVRTNAGHHSGPFVPFVFSLFLFVLLCNLLGMLPYAFTVTSHIIVTGALAVVVIGIVTLIGIVRHGLKFFTIFVPKGVPALMIPIIVPLEMISYCMRPISLSVRLFANMMAGHAMLKVFASFVIMLASSLGIAGYLVGIGPIVITVALIGFELMVALIQAYVFALLTAIYLHDALELH